MNPSRRFWFSVFWNALKFTDLTNLLDRRHGRIKWRYHKNAACQHSSVALLLHDLPSLFMLGNILLTLFLFSCFDILTWAISGDYYRQETMEVNLLWTLVLMSTIKLWFSFTFVIMVITIFVRPWVYSKGNENQYRWANARKTRFKYAISGNLNNGIKFNNSISS